MNKRPVGDFNSYLYLMMATVGVVAGRRLRLEACSLLLSGLRFADCSLRLVACGYAWHLLMVATLLLSSANGGLKSCPLDFLGHSVL